MNLRPQLPEACTMALFWGGKPIFTSRGRWLHPLFEAKSFLDGHPDLDLAQILLVDKVIGRAAAFLVLDLGIRSVYALTLSQGGKQLLETKGLTLVWDELIERTHCATEDLLEDEMDVQRAHDLLQERRLRSMQSLGSLTSG